MKWFTKTDRQPEAAPVVRESSITPQLLVTVGAFSVRGDTTVGCLEKVETTRYTISPLIKIEIGAGELDLLIEALVAYRFLMVQAKEDGAQ